MRELTLARDGEGGGIDCSPHQSPLERNKRQ